MRGEIKHIGRAETSLPYFASLVNGKFCRILTKDASVIEQIILNRGLFDQRIFYTAFQEFDNQSIEASLTSRTPLVRIFALLDRRLGKRRLAALEETMENELDWVRPFYLLRIEAEGLNLQKEKEVC